MTKHDDNDDLAKLLNEFDQSSQLLRVGNRLHGLMHVFDADGGNEK